MDIATLVVSFTPPALAAIVAAIVSYIAGRGIKSFEWRLALVKERLMTRERLYADFLLESSTHYLHSLDAKLERASDLRDIVAKFELISLQSSEEVVEAARDLSAAVVDANATNSTGDSKLDFYDLKQSFIRAARVELAGLQFK